AQLRQIFCRSILQQLGITSNNDPERDIFDRSYNEHIRHFIALCLLRFLAYSELWSDNAPTFRSETFKLFDTIFAHHLYGPLKIDSKKQSYEKEKALRAYVIGTETAIASSLSSFDHLASERWEEINLVFHDFRKSIGKAKLLITPF